MPWISRREINNIYELGIVIGKMQARAEAARLTAAEVQKRTQDILRRTDETIAKARATRLASTGDTE